ncbi:hypothetical protein KCP69_17600 [Salmonella enterica subsp. enterica]|nr:hypothetical protein KCP69_17600 [Salmonella enterica subsp. enterica]
MILAEGDHAAYCWYPESWIAEGKTRYGGGDEGLYYLTFFVSGVEGRITTNPVEAIRIPEVKVAGTPATGNPTNATRTAAEHLPVWFPLAMDLALVTGQRREDA